MDERFFPYLIKESGVYLLGALIENEGFSLRTRYQLQILTSLFQNGQTHVFKRIPPEVLGGMSEGSRANVEASFVARAGNRANSGDRASLEGDGREEGEIDFLLEWDYRAQLLESWARTNHLWYDDADEFCTKLYGPKVGNGAEANVYYDGDGYVRKTIGTIYDPQELLDRIAITNTLFPETGMELLGLGRNEAGEFCVVIKQRFIEGEYIEDGTVDLDVLSDFREINVKTREFVTDNLILGDLHDRNVLRSEEGRLFVIDCNTYLNTPDKGRGGKWQIPDIDYSEEAVRRQLAVLRYLTPRKASRSAFEKAYGPSFEEPVPATIEGKTVPIIAQVDPSDESSVLWLPVESLRILLSIETGLTTKERDALCEGKVFKSEQYESFFDLSSGKIMRTECVKKQTETITKTQPSEKEEYKLKIR